MEPLMWRFWVFHVHNLRLIRSGGVGVAVVGRGHALVVDWERVGGYR